ncbi:peptidoglycan DD-metalloendopeptidase family protein [Leptolyngbya sp. AN03gr2]|uniref:M23 family metallopeptidase n=1 Tax=unclassified Leptolyngbya TaxID=2650499 RepID=UPI003D32001A
MQTPRKIITAGLGATLTLTQTLGAQANEMVLSPSPPETITESIVEPSETSLLDPLSQCSQAVKKEDSRVIFICNSSEPHSTIEFTPKAPLIQNAKGGTPTATVRSIQMDASAISNQPPVIRTDLPPKPAAKQLLILPSTVNETLPTRRSQLLEATTSGQPKQSVSSQSIPESVEVAPSPISIDSSAISASQSEATGALNSLSLQRAEVLEPLEEITHPSDKSTILPQTPTHPESISSIHEARADAQSAQKLEDLFLAMLRVSESAPPHKTPSKVNQQTSSQPPTRTPRIASKPLAISRSSVSTETPLQETWNRYPIFSTAQPSAYPGNGDVQLLFPLAVASNISSPFGWRVHPISNDVRFHSGTDLAAPIGTPVLAAFSGQVVFADALDGYGITVILLNKNGQYQTLYGHLSEVFVQPGMSVNQGEVIGSVGSTGNSTGPHLHFELQEFTEGGWLAVDAGPLLELAATAPPQTQITQIQLPHRTNLVVEQLLTATGRRKGTNIQPIEANRPESSLTPRAQSPTVLSRTNQNSSSPTTSILAQAVLAGISFALFNKQGMSSGSN